MWLEVCVGSKSGSGREGWWGWEELSFGGSLDHGRIK